jgi:F-type H+-transporting ATPase subunit gamma
MASLKEVKGRIASVNNTRKITSAMKMVASAKLHKAQGTIEHILPYSDRLHRMLTDFLAGTEKVESPFAVQREVERVAVVVFSSNTSLCGAFNTNVIRRVGEVLAEYAPLGREGVKVYPVGRKVAEALQKQGWTVEGDFTALADKPNYHDAAELAASLMDLFLKREVDRVELVYHHFKSTAVQQLRRETFLPFDLSLASSVSSSKESVSSVSSSEESAKGETDYLVEPSAEELLKQLLPKVIRLKLYTVLCDTSASEHAARTMAMQIATDNANDLLQELTVMYNKSRQQAITSELLDIVGGQMA